MGIVTGWNKMCVGNCYSFELVLSICVSALTTYCNINVTIATHCKWLNHRGLPQLQPQYQRMCIYVSNKSTLLRRPIARSVLLGGDSHRLAQDICC